MHYADRVHMVRGDFFKPSGKWYATEAISMEHLWDVTTVVHAVAAAWWVHGHFYASEGFHLVVAEPYHRNAYPVMLTVDANTQALVDDIVRWNPELFDKLNQIRTLVRALDELRKTNQGDQQ